MPFRRLRLSDYKPDSQSDWPQGSYLERETGLEPATLALARRCSTTELLPHTSSESISVGSRPGQRRPVFPALIRFLDRPRPAPAAYRYPGWYQPPVSRVGLAQIAAESCGKARDRGSLPDARGQPRPDALQRRHRHRSNGEYANPHLPGQLPL